MFKPSSYTHTTLNNKPLDDRNVREDMLGFPPLVSVVMVVI